jgi:hypothetical protein
MASLMDTVFGGGVEELTKQRNQQTEAELQALFNQRRQEGNYDALGAFGTRLGTNLGDKLGAKIFGDPEMDKARSEQQAVEAIRNQYEPNDPRFGYAIADMLRKRGNMKKPIELFNATKEHEKKINSQTNRVERNTGIATNIEAENPNIAALIKGGGLTDNQIADLIQNQKKQSADNQKQDKRFITAGKRVFDTQNNNWVDFPEDKASEKVTPEDYIQTVINPDGSQTVQNVKLFFNDKGDYTNASGEPVNFREGNLTPFSANVYKNMSAKAQTEMDALDANKTALFKLHSINTNPAAEEMLGAKLGIQGLQRGYENLFASGTQREIVLKNINEFTIEGVLNYLKDLGGSDTEREFTKLKEGLPVPSNDINVWRDYELNTMFDVYGRVLNKTDETRKTAQREVSLMLNDFDPSELKLKKDGGLLKENSYVHKLIKEGKYFPLKQVDNLGLKRTNQIQSLVDKYSPKLSEGSANGN